MSWTLYSPGTFIAFVFAVVTMLFIIYPSFYHIPAKESKMATTTVHLNILCFGDSLTIGNTGRYVQGKLQYHPYSEILEKHLNGEVFKREFGGKVSVHNKGLNSERAYKSMETRLPTILHDFDYNWVIILAGTNDLRVLRDSHQQQLEFDMYLNATFNAIKHLHQTVHKHGGKTIVVTIPGRKCERTHICREIKEARLRMNEMLRGFAWDFQDNAVLADLDGYMPLTNFSRYWSDEVHFSPEGYDRMGTFIFQALYGRLR